MVQDSQCLVDLESHSRLDGTRKVGRGPHYCPRTCGFVFTFDETHVLVLKDVFLTFVILQFLIALGSLPKLIKPAHILSMVVFATLQ